MLKQLLAATMAVALMAPAAGADETKDKWASHKGDIPFVVGYAKGMAQVKDTGRPPMYFFTTTT